MQTPFSATPLKNEGMRWPLQTFRLRSEDELMARQLRGAEHYSAGLSGGA
jgi:hypothetical protein